VTSAGLSLFNFTCTLWARCRPCKGQRAFSDQKWKMYFPGAEYTIWFQRYKCCLCHLYTSLSKQRL